MKVDKISIATMTDRNIIGVSKSPGKGIIIYSDSCTALDRMNMFYRIPFTRSNVLGTEILKGI